MSLRAIVYAVWGVFWLGWLIAAFSSKRAVSRRRIRPPGLFVILGFLVVRSFKPGDLAVHAVALRAVGVLLFALGIALAVWARVYLGRNWGMPMTQKDEPELVTSGPYRLVRHPIYSGLIAATLGTALATNLYWLIVLAACGTYFIYSARVEERQMQTTFPAIYPGYRAHTKMLIPFVL